MTRPEKGAADCEELSASPKRMRWCGTLVFPAVWWSTSKG